MIGCLRTRVRKQPIIALYFESETGLKVYNLEACSYNNAAKGIRLLDKKQFLFIQENFHASKSF